MKRLQFREILGIAAPLLAVAFFLFLTARGDEKLIESPIILGALGLIVAALPAALFGIIGAVISGVVLMIVALSVEAPIGSAESMVFILPALAAWCGVGAVVVRRSMMRWQRRKHFEVGSEIERLRAKIDELEGLMSESGAADALSLSAQVWNDLLLGVSDSAETLMMEVPAEVRAGKGFQEFSSQVRRLQESILVTNDLIDDKGVSVAKETRLTDVVQNGVNQIKELAKALGIELEVNLQDDGIPCVVEAEALASAVAHVVRNAVEATGRAGKVTVDVHSDYRNERAMIEITDRGPGIPSDVIAQVFKPFFTTRRDRVGMGLTVAREVVNRAGGSIALAANEPRGMVVRLRLPVKRSKVVREREIEKPAKSTPKTESTEKAPPAAPKPEAAQQVATPARSNEINIEA